MLAHLLLFFALSFSLVSNASAGSCSTTSIDWVNKSYIAYYGRPADPGGLDYWACRLDSTGGDLGSIINAFGASDEFNLRYGSMSNEQLLVNIYQQMFNRDPDPEGKAWYLAKLNSGEMNLQTITLNVLGGATGGDSNIINNKLEVASYFTDKLESTQASYGNIDDARDIVSSVDGAIDSRDAAIIDSDLLIDTWTGLVDITETVIWGGREWQKSGSNLLLNWYDANTYCSNLTDGGYPKGSWVLPTISDLRSLIVCSNGTNVTYGPDNLSGKQNCENGVFGSFAMPTINANIFNANISEGANFVVYWSSTTDVGYPGYAWHVFFGIGNVSNLLNKSINTGYARCVLSE